MPDSKTEIYIKIDEYKDVLNLLQIIRNKIRYAKAILNEINQLKTEEDSELEEWTANIDEVERRIDFMDKVLFKPENA